MNEERDKYGRIVGRWRCPCGHYISSDPSMPPYWCDQIEATGGCECPQCKSPDFQIVDPNTADPKLRARVLVSNPRMSELPLYAHMEVRKRLVLVESPHAGDVVLKNLRYLRACLRDCFRKGEYPWASHAIYTQPGVLDDHEPTERQLGIEAGLAWGRLAAKTVVYTDLGISNGMKLGIERAEQEGRPVEYRTLKDWSPT